MGKAPGELRVMTFAGCGGAAGRGKIVRQLEGDLWFLGGATGSVWAAWYEPAGAGTGNAVEHRAEVAAVVHGADFCLDHRLDRFGGSG